MPIGFFAISRREVRKMLQARSGTNPSKWFLDIVVEDIKEELEKVLNQKINRFGHELLEEVNKP